MTIEQVKDACTSYMKKLPAPAKQNVEARMATQTHMNIVLGCVKKSYQAKWMIT